MSIDSISGYDSMYGVYDTQAIDQIQTTSTRQPATGTDSTQVADSANLSQGGSLMSQLFSLQKSDPAKFKSVAAKISEDLASAAKNNTDPKQSQMLSSLSEKFGDAAKTGEMPELRHKGGHGHSGHHKGYGKAGQPSGDGLLDGIAGIISGDLSSMTSASGIGATASTAAGSALSATA